MITDNDISYIWDKDDNNYIFFLKESNIGGPVITDVNIESGIKRFKILCKVSDMLNSMLKITMKPKHVTDNI